MFFYSLTSIVCSSAFVGVSACFVINSCLKVTGMKHVLDDDDLFMPFSSFPSFLRPPVQLPVNHKLQNISHSYSNTKNMLIRQSIVKQCVQINYIEPQEWVWTGSYFCCCWSFLRYSLFFFFFLLASYCPLSSNRAASTCSW